MTAECSNGERAFMNHLKVGIKGAGEIATGLAWRLYQSNIRKIFMMEIETPQAVRTCVCFCECVYEKKMTVEGVDAVRTEDESGIYQAWQRYQIAVIVDPCWKMTCKIKPDIIIDATISKKNLGTTIDEAPLVIGLGPGFEAGRDVHLVIETNRGHNLGRVIVSGPAEKNTRIPGSINGFTRERVLRAPAEGLFNSNLCIGMTVSAGDVIGSVNKINVTAEISGLLRGLIKPGIMVKKGMKIGDIDPRNVREYCNTISDKALAIGGGVLEAVLRRFNTPSSCGTK
jgi:xanthine dehydrogenase accessory factor